MREAWEGFTANAGRGDAGAVLEGARAVVVACVGAAESLPLSADAVGEVRAWAARAESRAAAVRDAAAERGGAGGRFAWVDGALLRAVEHGGWVLLDNAGMCSASVLDRLNPLLEPGGSLMLNECGGEGGRARVVRPHPRFRLLMAVDPRHGELSRAMRNRGLEIHMGSESASADEAAAAAVAEAGLAPRLAPGVGYATAMVAERVAARGGRAPGLREARACAELAAALVARGWAADAAVRAAWGEACNGEGGEGLREGMERAGAEWGVALMSKGGMAEKALPGAGVLVTTAGADALRVMATAGGALSLPANGPLFASVADIAGDIAGVRSAWRGAAVAGHALAALVGGAGRALSGVSVTRGSAAALAAVFLPVADGAAAAGWPRLAPGVAPPPAPLAPLPLSALAHALLWAVVAAAEGAPASPAGLSRACRAAAALLTRVAAAAGGCAPGAAAMAHAGAWLAGQLAGCGALLALASEASRSVPPTCPGTEVLLAEAMCVTDTTDGDLPHLSRLARVAVAALLPRAVRFTAESLSASPHHAAPLTLLQSAASRARDRVWAARTTPPHPCADRLIPALAACDALLDAAIGADERAARAAAGRGEVVRAAEAAVVAIDAMVGLAHPTGVAMGAATVEEVDISDWEHPADVLTREAKRGAADGEALCRAWLRVRECAGLLAHAMGAAGVENAEESARVWVVAAAGMDDAMGLADGLAPTPLLWAKGGHPLPPPTPALRGALDGLRSLSAECMFPVDALSLTAAADDTGAIAEWDAMAGAGAGGAEEGAARARAVLQRAVRASDPALRARLVRALCLAAAASALPVSESASMDPAALLDGMRAAVEGSASEEISATEGQGYAHMWPPLLAAREAATAVGAACQGALLAMRQAEWQDAAIACAALLTCAAAEGAMADEGMQGAALSTALATKGAVLQRAVALGEAHPGIPADAIAPLQLAHFLASDAGAASRLGPERAMGVAQEAGHAAVAGGGEGAGLAAAAVVAGMGEGEKKRVAIMRKQWVTVSQCGGEMCLPMLAMVCS